MQIRTALFVMLSVTPVVPARNMMKCVLVDTERMAEVIMSLAGKLLVAARDISLIELARRLPRQTRLPLLPLVTRPSVLEWKVTR